MNITAGLVQPGEDMAKRNVNDFKLNSMWHFEWAGTTQDKLWLTLDTGKERQLNDLAYMQGQDNSINSKVIRYEILVSSDNENWKSVATGEFQDVNDWQEVKFEAVKGRYVRFAGLGTLSDNDKLFMSASEVRASELVKMEHIPSDAPIVEDLLRLAYEEEVLFETAPIEFEVVRKENPDLEVGMERVIQAGKVGKRVCEIQIVKMLGKEYREVLSDTVTEAAVVRIIEIGTRETTTVSGDGNEQPTVERRSKWTPSLLLKKIVHVENSSHTYTRQCSTTCAERKNRNQNNGLKTST